jgi:hypothetical protein
MIMKRARLLTISVLCLTVLQNASADTSKTVQGATTATTKTAEPKVSPTEYRRGGGAVLTSDDRRVYFPQTYKICSSVYAKTFIPHGSKISVDNLETRDTDFSEVQKLNYLRQYVLTAYKFVVGKTAKVDLPIGRQISALDLVEYGPSDGSLEKLLEDEVILEGLRSRWAAASK